MLTQGQASEAGEASSEAPGSWPPARGNRAVVHMGPLALLHKASGQGWRQGVPRPGCHLMGAEGCPLLDVYHTPGAVLGTSVLYLTCGLCSTRPGNGDPKD